VMRGGSALRVGAANLASFLEPTPGLQQALTRSQFVP
jgi:hypothetical protein